MNLSFSGCGFMGVYHIGVIGAFRENAPEVLENKVSGCSAGALVAACALCGCCLGEMCSDVLEIAVRARSTPLGPFYPTFSIVDIIRNGLRRILPPNAHEICSGRLHISLTHWRDKKNLLVNEFRNRDELIDALICSSFVPIWSGIFPCKFRDEYYWDGGLTDNNPVIDENTILVSPFAGASDICPREESGSFYSIDFSGTDVSFTQENLARAKQALFPPQISVLKQICLNGYNDGLKFLRSRNMIKSSGFRFRTSISSVLGTKYTEPAIEEENELANGGIGQSVGEVYERVEIESDAESCESDESAYQSDVGSNDGTPTVNFSPYCEKVTRKKDLPSTVCAAFSAAAVEEADPIRQYLSESRAGRLASWMVFPIKVTYDITCSTTKKMFDFCLSSTTNNENSSSNRIVNSLYSYIRPENVNKAVYHPQDCKCKMKRSPSMPTGLVERSPRPTKRSRTISRGGSNPSFSQSSIEIRPGSFDLISSPSDFETNVDEDDQQNNVDCSPKLTQQQFYAKHLQIIANISYQLYAKLNLN